MTAKRVATVLAVLSAATAGYLAVRRAGERRGAAGTSAPVSTATRAGRSLQLARMGTTAGAGLAVHRARRTFAPDGPSATSSTPSSSSAPRSRSPRSLGNMKGALMKLGQMASYLDQGLPEPIREALAQLQADAPAMSAELAVETLEADLGRPLAELFTDWERGADRGGVDRAGPPRPAAPTGAPSP